MKQCPTCKSLYSAPELRYCLTDGSPLSAPNDSEPTLVFTPPADHWPPPVNATPSVPATRPGVSPFFAYALVAWLALLLGDGIAGRVRALAPDGVDAVLDCVGKGVLHATVEAGSSRMRAGSIADGGPGITTVFARSDAAILTRLAEMVDAGRLRVPIAATYPLEQAAAEQAAAAQAALRQPHPPGKIILVV